MRHPAPGAFYAFLDRPLYRWSRPLLVALVVRLLLSLTAPIWRISMEAPQYPKGLYLDIYAYTIEGGNDGQHLAEINTLNHYIGMHKIDRAELSDLDWLPFAIGILALLLFRLAVLGNVRSLVDLTVLTFYILNFAFGRFIYKLYIFGHNLTPDAPVKVPPFTPVIVGSKQIANFTTHSFPALGSFYLGGFAVLLIGLTIWHLWSGRRQALAPEAA